MAYYSLQNPLGSILYFVDGYSQPEERKRREQLISWLGHQTGAKDPKKLAELYEKMIGRFNLDTPILEEIFTGLGWMPFYVLAVLEEKKVTAFRTGLIREDGNTVVLTPLGKHILNDNTYNDYVNSIHFKANFWKLNNVKITDDQNIGSGFFIAPNEIITCKHVYEELDPHKLYIEDERGKRYNIEKTVPHPGQHIDLIKLITKESFDHFTYEIEENVLLTERVIVFGYPPIPLSSKAFLMANLGEVSSIVDNYLDGTDCLILSCLLRPGNSGGPIINEYGKLIGISIQNRSLKVNLTWNDMADLDLNKGLGYATGLSAKYLLAF